MSRQRDAAARPTAGRLVGGRYRLESVLGRGGMGVVWSAHDQSLRRRVAVKEVVVPRDLDPAAARALRDRTMREARTAARIWTEGSVAIYDVVDDGGQPWIVMEQLPPRTLQDELTETGGLPAVDVARIGLEVLAGLSAAHAAGVMHRDVKPGNVMFRPGPRGRHAVLGDFGIAHFDGDPTLTATGMMMGSPSYVAPERARGAPATAAADLWSLGVTLWAAVQGTSPFQRENPLATLSAVLTEEVPRADRAGPLEPLLRGLLQKDPAHRMDATQARRLLAALVAEQTPEVPAARAVERPQLTPTRPSVAGAPGPGATTPRAGQPAAATLVPARPAVVPLAVPSADRASAGRGRARWALPAAAAAAVVGGVLVLGSALDSRDPAGPSVAEQGATTGAEPAAPEAGDEQEPTADAPAEGDAPGSGGDVPATAGAAPDAGPAAPAEPAPGEGAPADGDGAAPPGDGAAAPAPETAQDAGAPPAGTPEGFVRYEDPTGFSVDVPAGWQPERKGPRVYLRDPGSSAYLLVDQTDDPAPDPVADWQAQEPRVAARLTGYERIGEIGPVDYRGWEAADWQFVFGENQGTRVLNRNVVTGPDHAYALYWSVPSSRWDAMLPVQEQIAASFQPAP